MVRLLVVLACSVAATPFALAQDQRATPISVPSSLSRFTDVRPGVPLGVLQSWIVSEGGQQRVAVTTQDGFTVVGDVIGPQGQDISSALLALSGLSRPQTIPPNLQSSQLTMPPAQPASPAAAPQAMAPSPASPLQLQTAAPALQPPAAVTPSSLASAASAAAPAGATPPIVMEKAQSLDQLLEQAIDVSAWFSAGTPKPGAPVIFFMADPTCPHCAVAVDMLKDKIQAGDIDLRVILAPIRSQQAVFEAASILQSATPGADFMNHELSKTTSTVSTFKVLQPSEIQPDVVRALQRNVEWMRGNGIQGVPFYIYNTAEGAKVEFGEVKDSMLAAAIPVRGSVQTAAQEPKP